jgi:hypothetical protein
MANSPVSMRNALHDRRDDNSNKPGSGCAIIPSLGKKQTSLLVPPETAQGRLGSRITLAAEGYLFRREKARAPCEEVLFGLFGWSGLSC